MWPWKSPPKPAEVPERWEDRLLRVEKTQEGIASSFKKIQLEWEDTYNRILKAVGRLNARDRTERQREERPADNGGEQTLDEINAAIRRGAPPSAFRRP